MREFRLLKADEIECRIAETKRTSNGNGYVRLLLYKTARTDAALLDEKFGIFGWRNEYKEIDGKMYCGIGIKSPEGEWVWKWNVGSESNMEAEKGQASDALKRAGFTWGLGTELYTAPDIQIWEPNIEIKGTSDKPKCYEKFSVKKIEYDGDGKIRDLLIVNEKGKEVYKNIGGKTFKADGIDPKPIVEEPLATDNQKKNVIWMISKGYCTYDGNIDDLTMAQAEAFIQQYKEATKK